MRPSESAIRAELRREAAKVSVPDGMWEKINERLDSELAEAEKRKKWRSLGARWRPALALAVAAGVFWMALIPMLPNAGRTLPEEHVANGTFISASMTDQADLVADKRYRREMARERAQAAAAARADQPMNYYTWQNMMSPR